MSYSKSLSYVIIQIFLSFLFLFAVIGEIKAEVLLEEDFDDMSLLNWYRESGTWTVIPDYAEEWGSSVIQCHADTKQTSALMHTGPREWTNYRLVVTGRQDMNAETTLYFRYNQDTNSYYSFTVKHVEFGAAPIFELRKVQGGQVTMFLQRTPDFSSLGPPLRMFVEIIDDQIHVNVNGVEVFLYNDTAPVINSGGVGLGCSLSSTGRTAINTQFAEVSVTSLLSRGKYPLIFIPGIMGSELKMAEDTLWLQDDGHKGTYGDVYNKDDVVWLNTGRAALPGSDDYFDVLRIQSNGLIAEAPLIATKALPDYDQTVNFFEKQGYVLGRTLYIFSYDWRMDIQETSRKLNDLIAYARNQGPGYSKVDIVAHSMGGLVAKSYLHDSGSYNHIRKLITLGTPYLGSPLAIKNFIYGECLTGSTLPKQPICLGISAAELKDVIHNMPGVYQLSPSRTYYNFYNGVDNQHLRPFRDDRDMDHDETTTGQLDYDHTKTLMTNVGQNTSLYTQFGEAYHLWDNFFLNNEESQGIYTDIHTIIGTGVPTLGQIREYYQVNFFNLVKITKKEEVLINGDETVPLFSASMEDRNTNRSLRGNNHLYYTHQTHGNLFVKDTPSLELVNNILVNDIATPSGIQEEPYLLEGKQYSVHSPIELHAYDQLGNHTGPRDNGDMEVNIPGSSYSRLDDSKYIWLPEGGMYMLKLKATDNGTFDLKIHEYKDDINTHTILYKNVPILSTTTAELQADTSTSVAPIINIDSDGNGVTDNTFQPSLVITDPKITADNTAPLTTSSIYGKVEKDGWYKGEVRVVLNADDDLAGIQKTIYSIDDQNVTSDYIESLVISKPGITKVRFGSIDNAGNEEYPQQLEVRIKNEPPEAVIQFNPVNKNIEVKSIEDSTITTESRPGRIQLTDLRGNETELTVTPKEKNRKEVISIQSISYAGVNVQNLTENKFLVSYKVTKNNVMTDLEQKIIFKGEERLRTIYDSKKNRTKIIKQDFAKNKITEEVTGLILIKIVTQKGTLTTQY